MKENLRVYVIDNGSFLMENSILDTKAFNKI